MTIHFDSIPANRRVGSFIAEFSALRPAALTPLVQPAVILAQMREGSGAGTGVEGTKYLVTSKDQATGLFGAGSIAEAMVAAFLANAPGHELYVIPAGDAGSSTAAAGTVTVTVSSNLAGSLYLRVAGRLVGGAPIPTTAAQSAISIAAAIAAAVNADTTLPVTAAVGSSPDDNVVTLTAKCKGTVGNQITLSMNARGAQAGEVNPSGVTTALSGALLTGGATDNAASIFVNALGSATGFDVIAWQNSDSTVLDALKTEVVDRWDYDRALDGVVIAAKMDSVADLNTFGSGRADRLLSAAGYPESANWLTPAYEVAAAYAGLVASAMAADPGAPIQGRTLRGVWPGTPCSDAEANSLAIHGIAPLAVEAGEVVVALEAVTSATSAAAEDIQIPFLLSRFRRRMRNRVKVEFPRHKLADDDQPIPGGSAIATPALVKGVLVGEYAAMVTDGLMQALKGFEGSIVVEQSADNPDRLDVYVEPTLIEQLRIVAMRISGV